MGHTSIRSSCTKSRQSELAGWNEALIIWRLRELYHNGKMKHLEWDSKNPAVRRIRFKMVFMNGIWLGVRKWHSLGRKGTWGNNVIVKLCRHVNSLPDTLEGAGNLVKTSNTITDGIMVLLHRHKVIKETTTQGTTKVQLPTSATVKQIRITLL